MATFPNRFNGYCSDCGERIALGYGHRRNYSLRWLWSSCLLYRLATEGLHGD